MNSAIAGDVLHWISHCRSSGICVSWFQWFEIITLRTIVYFLYLIKTKENGRESINPVRSIFFLQLFDCDLSNILDACVTDIIINYQLIPFYMEVVKQLSWEQWNHKSIKSLSMAIRQNTLIARLLNKEVLYREERSEVII